MREENRKEILTREIIKTDAKGILIHNIFCNLWFGLLFALLVAAFYGLFFLSDIPKLNINIIFSIILVVVIMPFMFMVISCAKMLFMLKKDCFDLTTDKVYDKTVNRWLTPRERVHAKKSILSFGIFKTDLILYFNNHKKFHLCSGGHYSFSESNKMQYYQQFNSTEICDEFYMLTIDNKIIEIYNTKFFELQQ